MGKQIFIPTDYKVADNDLGTLSLVSGNEYLGTNITDNAVRLVLGESTNSLSALCTSDHINKWAAFNPYTIDGTSDFLVPTFVFTTPTAKNLGDFIGYNHTAKPPVYYYTDISTAVSGEGEDTVTIHIDLARGEGIPAYYKIYGEATKTQIDIQTTWQGTTTHNRINCPSTGYYSGTVNTDVGSGTLLIKPVYYAINGEFFDDLSVIEDGTRSVEITKSSLLFNGSVNSISNKTGNNPFTQITRYSITRDSAYGRTIFMRLHVTGTGMHEVITTPVQYSFAGNETYAGAVSIEYLSDSGSTTTVTVTLEIADSDTFASLAATSFTWTTPGTPP
jgi:hypothetical protein